MNLDFVKDNYRFNARAAAIIYNSDKTKVLTCIIDDGRDYYMLPGGRIEMYEDSLSAIKREIKEELNWDLDFKLCSIQENFITKEEIKIMQYCFCYEAIYNGLIEDNFKCLDNDNQMFQWINIKELNDYKIVPKSTYDLLTSKNNDIKHVVEK